VPKNNVDWQRRKLAAAVAAGEQQGGRDGFDPGGDVEQLLSLPGSYGLQRCAWRGWTGRTTGSTRGELFVVVTFYSSVIRFRYIHYHVLTKKEWASRESYNFHLPIAIFLKVNHAAFFFVNAVKLPFCSKSRIRICLVDPEFLKGSSSGFGSSSILNATFSLH
jgi:hypothetical protein